MLNLVTINLKKKIESSKKIYKKGFIKKDYIASLIISFLLLVVQMSNRKKSFTQFFFINPFISFPHAASRLCIYSKIAPMQRTI